MNDIELLMNWCAKHFGARRLSDITWAHAVNSRERLELALQSSAMVFECDVQLNSSGEVILAHSVGDESDLALAEFLDLLRHIPQGLKLDIKDPAAVSPSVDALKCAELMQPVILNADVL
ncbi:MAG TPA: DUF2181 domain-containing protein, partial [Chloroflexia bacterium]